MAIAPPSISGVSSTLCCSRVLAHSIAGFPSISTLINSYRPGPRKTTSISRICSSKSYADGASMSPDSSGSESKQYELQHGLPSPKGERPGFPVFVTLPIDTVGPGGIVRRRKTIAQSFKALVAAGVEGVVIEIWWGLVEGIHPGVYDWSGYLELVGLAMWCGLRVRATLAFHQCGLGPGDPQWISLPQWVMEEIAKDPDIAFSDRYGRRSWEYISLGCDTLPVLRGRSPIQAYADFMRNFRDTFSPYLGNIVTGIQVGMGPSGELRYPFAASQTLTCNEGGEFQCYDKVNKRGAFTIRFLLCYTTGWQYMLASFDACAQGYGMEKSDNISNLSGAYGRFFLEWYSGMLVDHGERICREAETIFRCSEVSVSGKVCSNVSDLSAGYYNTSIRDGYIPIARMFGRYGFTLCCSGFEIADVNDKKNGGRSREGLVRQVLLAARHCEIAMEGENSGSNLDDRSFEQVVNTSKFYLNGVRTPSFSFNFLRMSKSMFEFSNWVRFTQFVKKMSEVNIFRAKLDFGGSISHSFFPTSAIGISYC